VGHGGQAGKKASRRVGSVWCRSVLNSLFFFFECTAVVILPRLMDARIFISYRWKLARYLACRGVESGCCCRCLCVDQASRLLARLGVAGLAVHTQYAITSAVSS